MNQQTIDRVNALIKRQHDKGYHTATYSFPPAHRTAYEDYFRRIGYHVAYDYKFNTTFISWKQT